MTYNAVEFLEGLFTRAGGSTTMALAEPMERPTLTETTVTDLPSDWRAWFEERAAIMEYQGGLSRERAEEEAWADTVQRMQQERALPGSGDSSGV